MAKKVMFTLSAEVVGEATSGLLLGEFNNWDYNDGIKLKKQKDGTLKATASLEFGKRYEYRYLLNDGRWVNDQSADHYVHISGFSVENCVINIPVDAEKPLAAEKKAVVRLAVEKVKAPLKKAVAYKVKAPVEKVVASKTIPTKAKGTI